MKNFRKNIIIVVTFITLALVSVYTYLHLSRNQITATTYKTPSDNISSESKTAITPSSADIIIYNSHCNEDYPSGLKVTDVGLSINDKLVKCGINSYFIKCTAPAEYTKSYENARNLIKNNVKDCDNKVLLDIHRDDTNDTEADKKQVKLTLSKSNPHYKANKAFVNLLSDEINKSSKVKSNIVEFNTGILYFNQDLSNNSVLVELGNNMSSNNDIEECTNALVSGLRAIQKTSSR